MIANLHFADRVLRFIAALVIAVLYFTGIISGSTALVLGIAAVLLLITSFLNFCPVYYLLGISTKKK